MHIRSSRRKNWKNYSRYEENLQELKDRSVQSWKKFFRKIRMNYPEIRKEYSRQLEEESDSGIEGS